MVLDEQEELIVKALVRDSRMSDNKIGKLTKVPIKTVNRKRKKLEQEDRISYFTALDIKKSDNGTIARHLYIIKFSMGQTKQKLMEEIKKEYGTKTLFTEMIYESHFAEIDGHTSIIMFVEGKNDDQISENFNGKILPLMLENHGKNAILSISTIRLSTPIRIFHNYLPWINMEKGKLEKNWSLDNIYIQKG